MKPKKAGSVRRLLPYMKGYWKECILGPIFKLLEAIFELIVPLVTAKMIDVGIANRDTGYIWKMGGAMFLLAACGLAFALICQYYASKCAYGFGTAEAPVGRIGAPMELPALLDALEAEA